MMLLTEAAKKYKVPALYLYNIGKEGSLGMHVGTDRVVIDEAVLEKHLTFKKNEQAVLRDQLSTVLAYILGEGLTQTELADYLGIDLDWIGRIQFRTPGWEILIKTCHALGMSTKLITGYHKTALRNVAVRTARHIQTAKKHLQ